MKLIHQDASYQSRTLAAAWILLVWFFKIFLDEVPLLGMMSPELFKPIGFMRLLPDRMIPFLLSSGSLTAIKLTLLGLFTLAIAFDLRSILIDKNRTTSRIRSSLTYAPAVLACFLLTLYQGLFRGFAGHISHEDILLQYALYLFTFFGLADTLAAPSGNAESGKGVNLNGIPMVTILFVLCYIYAMVSVFRMTHGGLETFYSDSITYWTMRNTVDYAKPFWGLGQMLLDFPLVEMMFKLGFPIITLVEFLAPLSLISRRFRIFFITTMISFHFATWLFMEVIFRETLLMYVLFFDLGKIAKKLGFLSE